MGRVDLDCFLPGDKAVVYIQLPGKDWEEHKIRIPKDATTITVAARTEPDALPTAGPGQAAGQRDLTGRVLDSDGQPLPDATLLVIQKTWPGGRFHQEPFTARSDADGKFSLPDLIPGEGQAEILVAAFRSGYAFASNYQTQRATGPRNFKPVTLRLAKAPPIALVVQDRNGRPVAEASVVPSSRQASGGEAQLIYFQGSESIQEVTDAEGRVDLDCFLPEDKAVVSIQLPGKDWEEHKIRIPKDAKTVTVKAKAAAN
jgi:HSP20 family molecular chaperone IbpA